MKEWEHFHIAIPTTAPPPDHSAKMLVRMDKEMRLTMSREAVINHLGRTGSKERPIPNTRSFGVILFWIGALGGILLGLVLDKVFG